MQIWKGEEGFEEVFKDIGYFAQQCKFKDCSHTNEPGCMVREAIESGELDPRQLKNFQKIKKEIQYLKKEEAQRNIWLNRKLKMSRKRNKFNSKLK